MKSNLILLLLLIPLLTLSQISQIGDDIDGEAPFDESGRSVSISADGTIIAIGAPMNQGNGFKAGHVRVYQNSGGNWIQLGDDIDGESANDTFGAAVSISADGNILAVGAPYNADNGVQSGHVRVFENTAGSWTQIGEDIDGEAVADFSGFSVSLSDDGNTVAIGAYVNEGNGVQAGHVRVYRNSGGSWTQLGADLDGEAPGDASGWSVSLNGDGNIVAVGANSNDGNGTDSGHVRVFQNSGGTWVQLGEDIDGETENDLSGWSVSLNNAGNILAVGAPFNQGNGTSSGHVRVFQNTAGAWTQIGDDIDGEAPGDLSGWAVSLNAAGNVVAIGARSNDGNGVDSGQVRIYQNIEGAWTQGGEDIDGESASDFSGSSVSLNADGTIVASGSFLNDGNGDNSGHVRIYELSDVLDVNSASTLSFSVYPSPTRGILNIRSTNTLAKIELFNYLGQRIMTSFSELNSIDLSNESSGLYTIRLTDEFGNTSTKKIVKQ